MKILNYKDQKFILVEEPSRIVPENYSKIVFGKEKQTQTLTVLYEMLGDASNMDGNTPIYVWADEWIWCY